MHATLDFRALVQAALATGARFSELANLRVSDFNPETPGRCTSGPSRGEERDGISS